MKPLTPHQLAAINADIDMARRSPEMALHVALDHGPQLVAEVERLREEVTARETVVTDSLFPDLTPTPSARPATTERTAWGVATTDPDSGKIVVLECVDHAQAERLVTVIGKHRGPSTPADVVTRTVRETDWRKA